ncbi:MAG: hypothetical protein FWC74_02940 [Candidatus Bathyarchaeota archaeon]|nr:hypothetical protein [Candidatus Termitimicrobium sp.]
MGRGTRGSLRPASVQARPCRSIRHHHFIRNIATRRGNGVYRHVGLAVPYESDVCEHCGWIRREILAYQQTQEAAV